MAPRGKGNKRTKRSGGKKRGGNRRKNFNMKEQASLTEITTIADGASTTLVTNKNYSSYNVSLNAMPRAKDIAKGYQYYRIKRITYIVKPTQDTFIGGGNSVPYLFYMIDRTKQFVNGVTLSQMKSMGAKPRRLDDKNLTFSYTPSVLTQTYDNTIGANTEVQYKLAPWLPTRDIDQVGVWNPNTTDHLGVVWRVEQILGLASAFQVERRVEVEFKKPAIPTTAVDPEDVPTEVDPELL